LSLPPDSVASEFLANDLGFTEVALAANAAREKPPWPFTQEGFGQ
jgi:hypothetical protein